MEAAYPIRFTQWALRPDSGGPGTHRGGLGAIYELELRAPEAELFVFAERARFAPRGVLGGQPGAKNIVTYQQGDGWHTPALGSKVVGVKLAEGQKIRLESPGGGGWGNPAARDPAAIARDAKLGYIG